MCRTTKIAQVEALSEEKFLETIVIQTTVTSNLWDTEWSTSII